MGTGKINVLRRINNVHTDQVTGLSIHPLGSFFLSCSRDKTWAIHNMEGGCLRAYIQFSEGPCPFTCMRLHPDGQLLATGTQTNQILMWQIATGECIESFSHDSALSALAFSENGYYMATGDAGGVVKVWDLRKNENVFEKKFGGGVTSIDFDIWGGQAIACASSNGTVVVTETQTWSDVTTLRASKPVAIGWNYNFKSMTIASSDSCYRLAKVT